MKIAALCNDDYANFMYCQVSAMKQAGINIEGYKLQRSPFRYRNELRLTKPGLIRNIRADVFIIFHSHIETLAYIDRSNNPRIIVVHTGTRFRQNYARILSETADFQHIIALPEFAELIPNAEYIVGCIDDKLISPMPVFNNLFGHFPSTPEVKGTETIKRIAREADISMIIDTNRLPNDEHLRRIMIVDIVVEMHNPIQGGRPYGSFGMQALEAAAMGRVVITNNMNGQDLYQRTYGDCELEIANTEDELLKKLLHWKYADTISKSKQVVAWYKDKHSMAATGRRWAKVLR